MKKLVWISEGCWFPDSLLYFKEQGFKITIIRTPMKDVYKRQRQCRHCLMILRRIGCF